MKFRSPTWLRNILDFEILTGKDITGKPSRRAVRKEINRREKERKQRLSEEKKQKAIQEKKENKERERLRKAKWNMRWRTKDEFKFRKYFKDELNGGNYVFTSELDDIKKEWRYKDSLWVGYDIYLKKEKERRERRERIESEVNSIYDSILSDWVSNKYKDKLSSRGLFGEYKVIYTMENGETVSLCGNDLEYKNTIYTMGLLHKSKFYTLFNHIISNINNGHSNNRPTNNKKRKSTTNSHPKKDLYDSIIETVRKREEQLKNMKSDDPDRESLRNELRVAKLKANKIKRKYSF